MSNPQASVFVEGTSQGNETLHNVYPPHIYDPVRRGIATHILGKEIAKITGLRGDRALEQSRRQVADWFDGIDIVMAPVHDYWSTFELLPLVKTKRLSRFITAENVDWQPDERPIDELTLTWMPFVESRPDQFGPGPWPIGKLRQVFTADPDLMQQAQISNGSNIGKYNFDHHRDPITLVRGPESDFFLDGNGRLYRAFMAGRRTVNCMIGTMDGKRPVNYWVSTGLIKSLCYDILDRADDSPAVSKAASILLQDMLATNQIARINYRLWIRKQFPQLEPIVVGIIGD